MTTLPTESIQHRYGQALPAGLPPVPLSYNDLGIAGALSDFSAVIFASLLAAAGYHWIAFGRFEHAEDCLQLGAVLAVVTTVLMKLKGLYDPDCLLCPRAQMTAILLVWGMALLFLFGASFGLKASHVLSRGWILSFAIAAPALILSQRILLKRLLASVLDHGWIERRNILLVADFATEPAPHQSLRAYNVFRTYVFPEYPDGIPSMMDRITNILRDDHCISEVHLALNWASWSDAKQLVSELRGLPVPVRLMADRNAQDILQYKQRRVCGAVSFELQRAPLSSHERAIKRLFDIAGSALGLLVLAPLFLVVSAAIRIDSPGPIVFRQKRGGFNGRAFHILKFRTMRVLEDGPVVTQAKRDDERVTRLGRWLRRSSLDELPQLINVLRGDMSLVGPRPHALAHDDQYRALISTYPFRHYVKPGITGWAQVKGFRGETPTINLMRGRVDLDLWYVGNWSFWLDLRILLRTAHEFCRSPNAF